MEEDARWAWFNEVRSWFGGNEFRGERARARREAEEALSALARRDLRRMFAILVRELDRRVREGEVAVVAFERFHSDDVEELAARKARLEGDARALKAADAIRSLTGRPEDCRSLKAALLDWAETAVAMEGRSGSE